jgi:hypothetical protein
MASKRKARVGEGADLDEMVRSGQEGAYEALQLYRSRANRAKLKGDFTTAIAIAARGARTLCPEYEKAGAELSVVLLELLVEADEDCTPENRSLINAIDAALPVKSPLRIEFLAAAIKWTMRCGSRELGDPMLHSRMGACLWELGSTSERLKAVFNFVVSEQPEVLWGLIARDISTAEERDGLVVYAVCLYLAQESVRDAALFFDSYRGAVKEASKTPLITFADQLLQTCRRDAAPLFQTLVGANSRLLDASPLILSLVCGPIAMRYFNLQQQQEQRPPDMMSMLQNMMGGR